jgi:hypothetical protein
MDTDRQWLGLALIATSADGYIAREDGDISWLTDAPSEPRHVPAHGGPILHPTITSSTRLLITS